MVEAGIKEGSSLHQSLTTTHDYNQQDIQSDRPSNTFTMHVKNLILLAFISISGAFIIPEGTKDGVYEHHVDGNGLDVHVKLANGTDYSAADLAAYSEARTASRVMRANDPDVKCGSGVDKHDLHHGVSLV